MPLKKLQTLVGKLRHALIILPAARGFFSPLNDAMRGNPKLIGLGAKSEVRGALKDLISLMHLLSSRPTHVRELVPDVPHHAGYHDAAAEGAGEYGSRFATTHLQLSGEKLSQTILPGKWYQSRHPMDGSQTLTWSSRQRSLR